MRPERICLTGATGFVGRALCARLHSLAYEVLPVSMRDYLERLPRVLSGDTIRPSLRDVGQIDVVIHLAARVHVMDETVADPLLAYRAANVEGTLRLAQEATLAGVKRFIFMSSVKVNGEQTTAGRAFRADDIPAPLDPYGISKMEAEIGLRALAEQTGMEVVIIRPPLVYGPGVKANFASMVKWIQRGIPLPLGAIHNSRSLVALDNLLDLITTCIAHPAAANRTLMVSDGHDVSTSELLRHMAVALGVPSRLVPVPQAFLEGAARLSGKQALAQRLFSSLQVDSAPTRKLLDWKPPVSLQEGLLQVASAVHNAP